MTSRSVIVTACCRHVRLGLRRRCAVELSCAQYLRAANNPDVVTCAILPPDLREFHPVPPCCCCAHASQTWCEVEVRATLLLSSAVERLLCVSFPFHFSMSNVDWRQHFASCALDTANKNVAATCTSHVRCRRTKEPQKQKRREEFEVATNQQSSHEMKRNNQHVDNKITCTKNTTKFFLPALTKSRYKYPKANVVV